MTRSKLSPAPPPDEMRYRAEEAMRTIARAEEHKRDKQLMQHVRALADQVHQAVGAETMKKKGSAPKNPSNDATGRKAKRGFGAAMKGESRKASKLAPTGAAKKRER